MLQITAQLLAKGTSNAIWADVNEINENNNINNDSAIEYLAFLEQSTPEGSLDTTKGAYDIVKTYYGNEPNKDGDGISPIIFLQIFILGCWIFHFKRSIDGAGSNQRDILYMDSIGSVRLLPKAP